MGKSIRSKAHKHKRSKRRERAEEHFDKLLDQRAEIAKKHLEQAQPVRDDEQIVAQSLADREKRKLEREEEKRARDAKRRGGRGGATERMQWEAMKPVEQPPSTAPAAATPASGSTMDVDMPYLRSRTTRSTRKFQGGKLIGVFRKTTKKERKHQKKKAKRSKK